MEFNFSMPAEWAEHEGTWLSWPKNLDTFPTKILPKVEEAYLQMIENLSKNEKVNLLVDDEKAERRVNKILDERGIKNTFLYKIKTSDVWIRDYGPIFVHDNGIKNRESNKNEDKKSEQKTKITKWTYNAYGEKYSDLIGDDKVAEIIAKEIKKEVIKTNTILEGGSIEVNGLGTLMTSEQCLLNKNRNKVSKEEIEQILSKYLGVKHFIWLDEGIDGDDTDGHIDDIARFVDPKTIVTVYEENKKDANYQKLHKNFELLSKSVDHEGDSLKIVKLPTPGFVKSDFGRIPASYANFYIGNKVVLLPVFNKKTDAQAIDILKPLFKGRKIVPIYSEFIVWGLGGIHCVTQQQPK